MAPYPWSPHPCLYLPQEEEEKQQRAQLQPTTVALTVPAGTSPGQLLQFMAPDGSTKQVQIPAGCAPGMTFQVQV